MTRDRRSSRHHPEASLSAFLDDELPEDEALEVARHLDVCEACHEELEELRHMRDALRQLPELPAPGALLRHVADAAEARHRRRRRTAVAVVAASASVGGLLTAAFVAGAPEGDVVPPVEVFVVDHVVRTGGGPVLTPVSFERP